MPRPHYRIGLPEPGRLLEIFNSDLAEFGGSDCYHDGPLDAEEIHPPMASVGRCALSVPPFGACYYSYDRTDGKERGKDGIKSVASPCCSPAARGSRLGILTSNVAKPAVPFGGKYRIIDFPLSNCVNSGIDTVGVLTQYKPLELNAYIGSGAPWDLDRTHGGVFVLPPYQDTSGGKWYKGTANAIYQNIAFVERWDPEYVLVLSGDHIYKMDYSQMLQAHRRSGAAATIAVREVPWDEAPRFGIMNTDGEGNITDFEEKPPQPRSNLASMGVYVFNWQLLKDYLARDEGRADSSNDFGKDIIPAMLAAGERLCAYAFNAYWKDVGTIASLWEANMDLLSDPAPVRSLR